MVVLYIGRHRSQKRKHRRLFGRSSRLATGANRHAGLKQQISSCLLSAAHFLLPEWLARRQYGAGGGGPLQRHPNGQQKAGHGRARRDSSNPAVGAVPVDPNSGHQRPRYEHRLALLVAACRLLLAVTWAIRYNSQKLRNEHQDWSKWGRADNGSKIEKINHQQKYSRSVIGDSSWSTTVHFVHSRQADHMHKQHGMSGLHCPDALGTYFPEEVPKTG